MADNYLQAAALTVIRRLFVDDNESRKNFIKILLNAYSGEKAAAIAYRGHWRSLSDRQEITKIQQIEQEEWHHRDIIKQMLDHFHAQPHRGKEFRCWLIGS